MKTFIFFIHFIGIFKLYQTLTLEALPPPPPPANEVSLTNPSGNVPYTATDQTAAGLNLNDFGVPREIIIEPVQSLPPGKQPNIPSNLPNNSPPPPYNINGEINNAGNTVNLGPNSRISFPDRVPTPGGSSQFAEGQVPTISLKEGSTVVHKWLPTNIMESLNIPRETGAADFNSLPPLQHRVETSAPSKSVTNVLTSQSGATQLETGSFVLPGRGQFPPANPLGEQAQSQPDAINIPVVSVGGVSDIARGQTLDNANSIDNILRSQILDEARIRNGLSARSMSTLDLSNINSIKKVQEMLKNELRLLNQAREIVEMGAQPVDPPVATSPAEYIPPPPVQMIQDYCAIYKPYWKGNQLNSRYFLVLNGDTYTRRRCAPGSLFNITSCQCSDVAKTKMPTQQDCEPIFNAAFQNGPRDVSSFSSAIQNEGAEIKDGAAYLNGNSQRMILWRFGGFDFGHIIAIKIKFKQNSTDHYGIQPIISNCQFYQSLPDSPQSISISVNNGREVTFSLMTSYDNTASLTLSGAKLDQWNEAGLSYDGDIMKAELNGASRLQRLSGNIWTHSRPIVIGNCKNRWFIGAIEYVRIYWQCIPSFSYP